MTTLLRSPIQTRKRIMETNSTSDPVPPVNQPTLISFQDNITNQQPSTSREATNVSTILNPPNPSDNIRSTEPTTIPVSTPTHINTMTLSSTMVTSYNPNQPDPTVITTSQQITENLTSQNSTNPTPPNSNRIHGNVTLDPIHPEQMQPLVPNPNNPSYYQHGLMTEMNNQQCYPYNFPQLNGQTFNNIHLTNRLPPLQISYNRVSPPQSFYPFYNNYQPQQNIMNPNNTFVLPTSSYNTPILQNTNNSSQYQTIPQQSTSNINLPNQPIPQPVTSMYNSQNPTLSQLQQSTNNLGYNSTANLSQNPTSSQQPHPAYDLYTIPFQQPSFNNLHSLPPFNGNPKHWNYFISQYYESTLRYNYSCFENTRRLREALRGEAFNNVEPFFTNPQNVNSIIETLQFLYGRPELLLEDQLDSIEKLENIPESNMQLLIPTSVKIQQIISVLETLPNNFQHMNNPTTIKKILEKLPPSKREQWIIYTFTLGRPHTLKDLSDWIYQQANIQRLINPKHQFSNNSKKYSTECCLCKENHSLMKCPDFKQKSVSERWTTVKKFQLCISCFRSNHSSKDCRSKQVCGIDNCQEFHSKFLHNRSNEPRGNQGDVNNLNQECLTCETNYNNLYFKIIPIKIYNKNQSIETYALIDEGSKLSLIDASLLDELNINIENSPANSIRIKWYGKEFRNEQSKTISIEISGQPGTIYTLQNIKTIENLDLPTQSMNAKRLPSKYEEFRNLPISYSNAKPRLLLGLGHCTFGYSKDTTEKEGLIATNTKLGWSIHGSLEKEGTNDPASLCLHLNYEEENLHNLVSEYINSENHGIISDQNEVQEEDAQAMQILENTTSKITGSSRFKTGLLWKHKDVKLPNNFKNAYKRLLHIESRMNRDAKFAEKYEENLMNYVSKGYAKILSKKEIEEHTGKFWYLPHFVSLNANKPEKFRIVFDAADKCEGISLNSCLFKGPDLNQPLLKLLMNFRIGKIAVCADIREMFNQIQIQEEDQHCQRFLWRHGDSKKPIETYIMTAMLFGASCSPCSAQYVKNLNATQHLKNDKEAAEAILENHYVDDFIMSFENEEDAIRISRRVKEIHLDAGFYLTKFSSNSTNVLRELGEITKTDDSEAINSKTLDKILGLFWHKQKDMFTFKTKLNKIPQDIIDRSRKPTKREILRTVMSIYDPFGFLNYFTVICRILIQEIWKTKIGWDCQINDSHNIIWDKWLTQLGRIHEIEIPRCYFNVPIDSCELHIFTDASEKAYCSVAYLRIELPNKNYELSFVMSKVKVAPINKATTIPRLELQGAVLGCKLQNIITNNLKLKITGTTFWCDSKAVLYWIINKNKLYKPFVNNRTKFINENSRNATWKYINTKENVADFATKCKQPNWYPKNEHIWLQGPDFLRSHHSAWSTQNIKLDELELVKEEILLPIQVSTNLLLNISDSTINISDYSSYHVLKCSVAWILRAKNNFIKGVTNRQAKSTLHWLKVSEHNEAEILLCKLAQKEAFIEEIDCLSRNIPIPRSSSIKKLTPYLDEKNLLRVHGRLEFAQCIENKRPIILPKNNSLSSLILKHHHEIFKHQNTNLVVVETRRKFWIPNIKSQLKKVIQSCHFCVMKNKNLEPPIMSPLPEDRVLTMIRPFSYSGIDYCGPFDIKERKMVKKRWIVIFNCLTTRAIHLEIARDLKSDTCLLCINNFINRRGIPVRIRSDNAKYFVSSNKTINKIFSSEEIQSKLSSKGIDWWFNCPETPHMGGTWERLIQCVKKILTISLSSQTVFEPIFYSIVVEAECMVNSRPLIEISDDIEQEEPISPNHFLIGSSAYQQSAVLSEESLKNVKLYKQFRILNNLKTHIWKRWETEYLPQLIPREKWYTKRDPPEVDDFVIFNHQNKWTKGRISKTNKSKDNIVRTVEIVTNDSTIKRSVHNIKFFKI